MPEGLGFIAAILVVFYLYLLVRPQYVRRGLFLWVGLAGILSVLLGMFLFTLDPDKWSRIVFGIFGFIGVVVSLLSAAVCRYGKDIPLVEKRLHREGGAIQTPPPHSTAGGETGVNP